MDKSKILTIADPETIARKRALEFLALSPTQKFESMLRLIKISYEVRQSNKQLKQ